MIAAKTVLVVSTEQALGLSAGCHKAIPTDLLLPAGVPTPVPATALSFVLTFPGVAQVSAAGSPEPANPEE